MNVASRQALNLLSKKGVTRAVLARELSFEEIKAIRENTNIGLEVFVHGALCISVSGLCLFSSYLGGKSANRGACTQACRRCRNAEGESGYYFSPHDLQLLEKLPALMDIGVDSFKIEGRMKSAEYVGTVVRAYRLVMDGGAAAIPEAKLILENDFARKKTVFHFDDSALDKTYADGIDDSTAIETDAGNVDDARVTVDNEYIDPQSSGGTGILLGTIKQTRLQDGSACALVGGVMSSGALPEIGDTVRLHKANDSGRVSHKLSFVKGAGAEQVRAGAEGAASAEQKNAAQNSGGFWCDVPDGYGTGDTVYLVQRKAALRYPKLFPRDLGQYKRKPLFDSAPPVKAAAVNNKALSTPPDKLRHTTQPFPAGIYLALANAQDMYIAQAENVAAVILDYSAKNAAFLLKNRSTLPVKNGRLVINLKPDYFERETADTESAIKKLQDAGFHHYIVNNLGQAACFQKDASSGLIAGPYLYMFNAYSLAFVRGMGFEYFISPLENSKQNLEKTVADSFARSESPAISSLKKLRENIFITIYAEPALFRIADDLYRKYSFGDFSDSTGENFRLCSAIFGGGAIVTPERPFYIADKLQFLQKAGYGRFIVDLSTAKINKKFLKGLFKMINNGAIMDGASRFNWKDGFYC
jgi:putative protease